jgi:arsenite methyltransferase
VSSDILIVDKNNDLNIYKERNQDSGESSCCGTAENKETASTSSCCAPAVSCPSTSAEKSELDKADLAKRVADIDFNEWVSKCSLFSEHHSPQVTFCLGSFSIYAVKPTSST